MKTVLDKRLARLAKTDLIRDDYAKAGFAQGPDHIGPVVAGEVFSVEKKNRLAVWVFRADVHIRHSQILTADFHLDKLNRVRIPDIFKCNRKGIRLCVRHEDD